MKIIQDCDSPVYVITCAPFFFACAPEIDHMHMTSQKGAQVCWGSNEALPRGPSPSMQPAGQPLHAIPPGWAGWPGPRTDWGADALCQHNMCAQRDKSWPPAWRRCYGDVTSMHKVYCLFFYPSTGYRGTWLSSYKLHRAKYFDKQKKKTCPNIAWNCPNNIHWQLQFSWGAQFPPPPPPSHTPKPPVCICFNIETNTKKAACTG